MYFAQFDIDRSIAELNKRCDEVEENRASALTKKKYINTGFGLPIFSIVSIKCACF